MAAVVVEERPSEGESRGGRAVGSMERLGMARRPQHARRRQGTRQGGGGAQLAWLPCPGRVSHVGAFHRTAGGCQSRPVGTRFWASCRPIWSLGQLAQLEPTRCSTNLIKGLGSLGFSNSK
jgi:hypothetical protein